MQLDREKPLFMRLLMVRRTIEIRYQIRVPYFYYTNQKRLTGQIPSDQKTVRRTVFRERVAETLNFTHAVASEKQTFNNQKHMSGAPKPQKLTNKAFGAFLIARSGGRIK